MFNKALIGPYFSGGGWLATNVDLGEGSPESMFMKCAEPAAVLSGAWLIDQSHLAISAILEL